MSNAQPWPAGCEPPVGWDTVRVGWAAAAGAAQTTARIRAMTAPRAVRVSRAIVGASVAGSDTAALRTRLVFAWATAIGRVTDGVTATLPISPWLGRDPTE